MQNLNYQLFSAINAGTDLHGLMLTIAIIVAKYLVYLVPIWLVLCWLFSDPKNRSTLIFAVIATGFALLLAKFIEMAWFQPRPFMLNMGHTYLIHAPDSTFPSDHVTFIWAVGLSFITAAGLRKSGSVLLLLALAVGWARIFVGIHFPFDVLGGVLLASIAVLILIPFRPWINHFILPSVEHVYRRIFSKLIAKKIVQA